MIDILIDDDNKVSIKTTNGIGETEIAAAMVVEAMRSLTKPKGDPKAQTSYYLYLKPAKDITGSIADDQKALIMQSYDYNVISRLRGSLERLGFTCEVTSN